MIHARILVTLIEREKSHPSPSFKSLIADLALF